MRNWPYRKIYPRIANWVSYSYRNMIPTSFTIPRNSFVDIDTIRNVAEKKPTLFKTEGYVSTELNGATNKQ